MIQSIGIADQRMFKAVFQIVRRLTAFGLAIAAAWPLIAGYTRFIKSSMSYLESLFVAVTRSIPFFEVWTTSAIFVVCIAVALGRASGTFLSRHSTISAVASYVLLMFVLSPIYYVVLIPNLEPYLSGLFLLWWIIFSDHGGLQYRDALKWLWVPASYFALAYIGPEIVSLFSFGARGISFDRNPWYFTLGMLVLAFGLACLYCCLPGLIIIWLDKAIARLKIRS